MIICCSSRPSQKSVGDYLTWGEEFWTPKNKQNEHGIGRPQAIHPLPHPSGVPLYPRKPRLAMRVINWRRNQSPPKAKLNHLRPNLCNVQEKYLAAKTANVIEVNRKNAVYFSFKEYYRENFKEKINTLGWERFAPQPHLPRFPRVSLNVYFVFSALDNHTITHETDQPLFKNETEAQAGVIKTSFFGAKPVSWWKGEINHNNFK